MRLRLLRYGVPEGWDVLGDGIACGGELRARVTELPLRGEHNALNLCGALAALEALGIEPELPAALEGFQPLAHRLQPVAERDGVLWVDDSISTTPESTLAALASFPGRELILIGGGQDRGQDYAQLGRVLAERLATVIGVPTTGPRLLAAARDAGVPAERALAAADLREAVALARDAARPAGRRRPALAGRSELRQLQGLRAARRALSRAGRSRGQLALRRPLRTAAHPAYTTVYWSHGEGYGVDAGRPPERGRC